MGGGSEVRACWAAFLSYSVNGVSTRIFETFAKGRRLHLFSLCCWYFGKSGGASLLRTTKAFVVTEKIWLKKEALFRIEREWRFTLGH